MRRDLYLLLLLFIAIDFLDAYTLPLDSEPTDLDLQWANLDSVQNRPLPCYAGRSYVRMVKKRQKTTGCIGENCGANDGMIPETSATDDQPVKQNDLVDNPGESFELAANLNSGSQGNIFNDGHQNWDDAIASLPLNDAATNIPPSAPTGQNTLDQTETEVSDSMADGALNDAFEIATLPKNPASIIEQDPETGYVFILAKFDSARILTNPTESPWRVHVCCHPKTSRMPIWFACSNSRTRCRTTRGGTLRPSWSRSSTTR